MIRQRELVCRFLDLFSLCQRWMIAQIVLPLGCRTVFPSSTCCYMNDLDSCDVDKLTIQTI